MIPIKQGESVYIQIDRSSSKPMLRQIYDSIKSDILDGNLKADEKLPSSRKLAEDLHVSRNIVVEAYEMLTAEGYTITHKGSGTFVKKAVSISRPERKYRKTELKEMKDSEGLISFRSGLPVLDSFPSSRWMKCYRDALYLMKKSDLGYDFSNGYLPFRKTMSEYLYRSRGIKCRADQIIITSGAVQGLYLAAKYFYSLEGSVICEEPTTKGLRDMLEANHRSVIYSEVDGEGIVPSALPQKKKISCIFTTPSHQYPLGGTLSVQRRIELITFARKHGCFIVEDDYDSEFRYDKAPVESLYELDPERVIYIGSFSKVFAPGIRIGYMVLPEHLVDDICRLKGLIDIHCPTLNQAAMERFIGCGFLEQHLFAVKKIYRKRRDFLLKTLISLFGRKIEILGSNTGIHITVRFEGVVFTDSLIEKIRKKGVFIVRVSDHAAVPLKHMSELIFGYSNLQEKDIKKGLEALSECLS